MVLPPLEESIYSIAYALKIVNTFLLATERPFAVAIVAYLHRGRRGPLCKNNVKKDEVWLTSSVGASERAKGRLGVDQMIVLERLQRAAQLADLILWAVSCLNGVESFARKMD